MELHIAPFCLSIALLLNAPCMGVAGPLDTGHSDGFELFFKTSKDTFQDLHITFSRPIPNWIQGTYVGIFVYLFTLKPIFHQNANYLASGTFASPNATDSTFASPTARNTNMLVSLALGDASFLRWPCTFLFLCVYFFALGGKRKPHFQWNIGCIGSWHWVFALGMYISCVR